MSGNEEVKVQLGADFKNFQEGMTQALSVFKTNMTQMKGAADTGAKGMTSAIDGFTNSFKSSMGGLGGIIEKIKGPFLALSAVLGGGAIFGEMVKHTAELGDALLKTSQKIGVSVEDLSRMRYAAELADVPFETLTKGFQRLALNMQAATKGGVTPAGEAFKALGISVADAEGNLKPSKEVVEQLADKFQHMEDGAGKTALAMNIFGKAGAEMIPFLNQGRDGIEAMGAEADKLGITMSTQSAEAAEKYNDNLKRIKAVGEGLSQTIGNALIPILGELAGSFVDSSKDGGALQFIMQALEMVLKGIATAILGIKLTLEILFEIARNAFNSIVILTTGVWKAIKDAISGNFAQAKQDIKDTNAEIEKNNNETLDRIADKAQQTKDRIVKIWTGGGDEKKKEGGAKSAAPAMDGKDKNASLLPAFKAELEQKKDAADTFHDVTKADEAAYWKQILETHKLSAKDRAAVEHEYIVAHKEAQKQQLAEDLAALKLQMEEAKTKGQDRVALAEQVAARIAATYGKDSKEFKAAQVAILKEQESADKAQEKLQENAIERQKAHSLAMIAMEKEALTQKKAMGEVNAVQELKALRGLEDQEYQAELTALQAKQKLGKDDAQHQADVMKQIEALDAKHQQTMLKNQNATQLAVKAKWDQLLSGITSAFDQSIKGMIQGTTTWRQALVNIWKSITAEFVGMGVKMAMNWVSTEIAKTSATAAGATARGSIEEGATLKSLALKAWEGLKWIGVEAAKAAAGAWAAIVGIPYVGPILAPIAAGVALAGVLALGSKVASASGGYDIPQGTNPMTQLHAEEMVLPAHLANPIRKMAEGGGGNGSGGVNITIQAMDGQDVHRVLTKHQDSLFRVMREGARNGRMA